MILEIIPLSCVAASSSNYTSVNIDLDNADLVQMSIKMPEPTGKSAKIDCTEEVRKYLYEQKGLLPLDIHNHSSSWWLASDKVRDYALAARRAESYRVANLLGLDQPFVERGPNDFKAARRRGTERCNY